MKAEPGGLGPIVAGSPFLLIIIYYMVPLRPNGFRKPSPGQKKRLGKEVLSIILLFPGKR